MTQAMRWVFDHSPYTGTSRLVHLTIARLVDEFDDVSIWLEEDVLAPKAQCSIRTLRRAVAQMVEDGFLEKVDDKDRGVRVFEYRFMMPGTAGKSESRPEVKPPMPKNKLEISDRMVVDMMVNTFRARLYLSIDDFESADRALFIARHALDLALLSTVGPMEERTSYPDLYSEFHSVAADLGGLVSSWIPKTLKNEREN